MSLLVLWMQYANMRVPILLRFMHVSSFWHCLACQPIRSRHCIMYGYKKKSAWTPCLILTSDNSSLFYIYFLKKFGCGSILWPLSHYPVIRLATAFLPQATVLYWNPTTWLNSFIYHEPMTPQRKHTETLLPPNPPMLPTTWHHSWPLPETSCLNQIRSDRQHATHEKRNTPPHTPPCQQCCESLNSMDHFCIELR